MKSFKAKQQHRFCFPGWSTEAGGAGIKQKSLGCFESQELAEEVVCPAWYRPSLRAESLEFDMIKGYNNNDGTWDIPMSEYTSKMNEDEVITREVVDRRNRALQQMSPEDLCAIKLLDGIIGLKIEKNTT